MIVWPSARYVTTGTGKLTCTKTSVITQTVLIWSSITVGIATMTDTNKISRHLWEYDHPYYCNEGNYFSRDCHSFYKSWEDYIESEGDLDMDYNLLFRWDWKPADTEKPGDELHLYYMTQRKGYNRSVYVQVKKSDEPEIREWLLVRAARMRVLWEPLIPPLEESPPPEAPEVDTTPNPTTGTCECCKYENVPVRNYGDGGPPRERTRYLCKVCSYTHISSWVTYDQHTRPTLSEVGPAIAFATNEVLAAIEKAGGPQEREHALELFIDKMSTLADRAKKPR